ncbi:hypothetical protein [Aestuariispira insulae]|uniref:Uncharacterized protein n=1 Tax=Aestuariispira insulae TaxID=1461337 RepID=A0A3D9HS94_9PROT|nr:hypothetical protein [Aestuariispira insulae]RED52367.1 hypothetical protein DFP90_102388 [Aestuariispira insulae]
MANKNISPPAGRERRQRLIEFIESDIQYDLRWAAFLIKRARIASINAGYYWEGPGNTHYIRVTGQGVILEPLYRQYPDNMELSLESFIAILENWKETREKMVKPANRKRQP